MPNHFEVDPEQLRSHAGEVDGIGDQANTALDAANQVATQPFDMAYGVLCQAFPQAMRPTEEAALRTLQNTVRALRTMSDNLGKSADHYQQVDDQHAFEIGSIAGMLQPTPF